MKTLIVDDEPLARRLTREYLNKHGDIDIVGECENGVDAVAFIEEKKPDLIFMDIHMPKMSGLEVIEVTGQTSGVIFTTAYDDYALKAFDLHAVDYLLKPFSQERFDAALLRARQFSGQPSTALTQLVSHTQMERIVVRDRGQLHFIPVRNIDFIEAQDDYIMIHSEGKSTLKPQALGDILNQLDASRFFRIHRSFIINIEKLNRVERVNKDSLKAILKNGTELPVSRAGYERIRALVRT